jgi:hypothetical protein
MNFLQEIQNTVVKARGISGIKDLVDSVDAASNRLGEVALHLGKTAMSPDVKVAFAFAKPFLDVVGDVCMAWMHLWRAVEAVPQLEKQAGSLDPAARSAKAAKNKEAAFYEGGLQSAKYFFSMRLSSSSMDSRTNTDIFLHLMAAAQLSLSFNSYSSLFATIHNPFCHTPFSVIANNTFNENGNGRDDQGDKIQT